jgi:hypothetical protein
LWAALLARARIRSSTLQANAGRGAAPSSQRMRRRVAAQFQQDGVALVVVAGFVHIVMGRAGSDAWGPALCVRVAAVPANRPCAATVSRAHTDSAASPAVAAAAQRCAVRRARAATAVGGGGNCAAQGRCASNCAAQGRCASNAHATHTPRPIGLHATAVAHARSSTNAAAARPRVAVAVVKVNARTTAAFPVAGAPGNIDWTKFIVAAGAPLSSLDRSDAPTDAVASASVRRSSATAAAAAMAGGCR